MIKNLKKNKNYNEPSSNNALNKILQANRKLNEKKINEEEKLKMDNKNRERKRKELNRQHNMIKKKVIRNKINYDSEEEEGNVINVSDEDNNVNKKKEKLKKIIKLKDKKK